LFGSLIEAGYDNLSDLRFNVDFGSIRMLIESYDRRKERADGNKKQTTKTKDVVSTEVQKDIIERTSVEGLLF